LGVVGESGCGKSTLARLLLHLVTPDAGEIVFDGDAVGESRGIGVADLRRQVQMVFQDSSSSLNPRMPVQDSVAFGPMVNGHTKAESRRIAQDILVKVGLRPDLFGPRYPHELSGGQKKNSVSISPERSQSGRVWSSSTRPFRRWTSRSRRRCSTCCVSSSAR